MITDIATLRAIIPTIINDAVPFERYAGALTIAEAWLVGDVVGAELMATIRTLNPADPLHTMAQRAVAYRGYAEAVPGLDVRETPNGFAVVNDEKFAPASTARVQALVASMNTKAAEIADQIRAYLETSAEYCEQWRASGLSTILSGTLLPTLTIYRQFGEFTGDRAAFRGQQPQFANICHRLIVPHISAEMLEELLAQIATDTLTEDNAALLRPLRSALAAYWSKNPTDGDFFVTEACRQLDATPDNFPTYKNSTLYKLKSSYKPAEAQTGIGLFL